MFLKYLLSKNIDNKLFILGFFFAIIAYSFWQPIEGILEFSEHNYGKIHFISIAFAFACYTSAYMFSVWDSWRWFPMIVVFICISRIVKELLFLGFPDDDPTKYDYIDYINALITVWIVFNYYIRWKFKRYKARNT